MAYSLRIQWPTGKQTVREGLSASTTVAEFQTFIESLTGIAIREQRLLAGYPVTAVVYDETKANNLTLNNVGLHRGETVRVERRPATSTSTVEAVSPHLSSSKTIYENQRQPSSPASSSLATTNESTDQPIRRIVPADNSCLFRAVAYLLHPVAVTEGYSAESVPTPLAQELRAVVAEKVLSDPATYSEAMLGRPPLEYAQWIQKPESWGGGIELSIFAQMYQTMLCAVDIQTLRIDCFGEDQPYTHLAFLIYDGIHYDPMVVGPGANPPDAFCTRVFQRDQFDAVSAIMLSFARQQKQQHRYTDTSAFSLRCLVCQKGLQGQTAAQAHAKQTGHVNFGEYKA